MTHEIAIRLGCFAGVLLLVAFAERLRPRRHSNTPRASRWWANLAITALNPLLLGLLALPFTGETGRQPLGRLRSRKRPPRARQNITWSNVGGEHVMARSPDRAITTLQFIS